MRATMHDTRGIMRGIATLGALLALAACGKKDTEAGATDSANAMTTTTAAPSTSTVDANTPPAANGDMQPVLDQLAALGGKPIAQLTPAEARKQPTPTDAVQMVLRKQGKSDQPDASIATTNTMVTGAAGPIPATIYKPKDAKGPLPVVVYYHGGGWVIADRQVYDGGARSISKMANAIVVSVDYRQGPEHRFPAAHDDAVAAYKWALANAAKIGGDPKKVALAGESAGGGLAVATAMAARDQKLQQPLAVVSVYPIAGSDTTTPSYVQNATAKPLDRPMMSWFFRNYLRSDADRADPRIDLVHADLKGLPPTTIINAQIDPLRSDGELLAQHLKDAGVDVQQKTFDGVTHEFFGMGPVVGAAKDAEGMAGDALKKAFGG